MNQRSLNATPVRKSEYLVQKSLYNKEKSDKMSNTTLLLKHRLIYAAVFAITMQGLMVKANTGVKSAHY